MCSFEQRANTTSFYHFKRTDCHLLKKKRPETNLRTPISQKYSAEFLFCQHFVLLYTKKQVIGLHVYVTAIQRIPLFFRPQLSDPQSSAAPLPDSITVWNSRSRCRSHRWARCSGTSCSWPVRRTCNPEDLPQYKARGWNNPELC